MTASETKKRAPYVLVALLISQMLLISAQKHPEKSEQTFLRIGITAVFAPVQRALSAAFSFVDRTIQNYIDLRNARVEYESLLEKYQRVEKENQELREEAEAARRLRSMLELKEKMPYRMVAARVIARDTNAWFKRIAIDKGTESGIRKDAPVITPDGLVGRVIQTGPLGSQVQLITDQYAGVGAMLSSSRIMGEIKGQDDYLCVMKSIFITGNETVSPGERVITSGLDGIYPKGLVIGQVVSVSQPQTGAVSIQPRILVQPAVHLNGIEEVAVLLVNERDLRAAIEEADGGADSKEKQNAPAKAR